MSNDPLHGKKLADILEEILAYHNNDWSKLAERIPIRCFQFDPSIKSSLAFLRKTPWARTKVENMYLFTVVRKQQQLAEKQALKEKKAAEKNQDISPKSNTENTDISPAE